MPACKFTKKTLLHIFFHVFYLHFLRMYHDYFCRRGLKVCKCNLFQRKVVLLVIYLFTIFMLNMAFDVLLNAVFVKYSELESFVSCNIKLFALCFDMYYFLWKPNYSPSWWYNFIFWYLYQIHTFINNLIEEYLTWCVLTSLW